MWNESSKSFFSSIRIPFEIMINALTNRLYFEFINIYNPTYNQIWITANTFFVFSSLSVYTVGKYK